MSALALIAQAMAAGFMGDPPYYVPEGPGECPTKIYEIYVPVTTTNVSTVYQTEYETVTRPASTITTIITVVDSSTPSSSSTSETTSEDNQTSSSTGTNDDSSSSTVTSSSANDEASSTTESTTTSTTEDSSTSTTSTADETSTTSTTSVGDEDTSTTTSTTMEENSTTTTTGAGDEDSSTSTGSSTEASSTSSTPTPVDDSGLTIRSTSTETTTTSSTTTAETTTTSTSPTPVLPPYVIITPTDFPQPIPSEGPDVTKQSAFQFPANGPFWRYESYPDGTLGVFRQGSSSTAYQTNERYLLYDFPSSNEFSISRGYTLIINANGTFRAFVNSRRPVSETLVSDDVYEVAGFWKTQSGGRRRSQQLFRRQGQDVIDTDCAIKDICDGNSVLQTFPKGLNLQAACDRIEANLRAEIVKNQAYVGQNSGDLVTWDGDGADGALDKDWIRNRICDEGIRLFRNRLCASVNSTSCA